MMYAAELTWNGQKEVEGEYQKAVNRMASIPVCQPLSG